MAFRAWILVLFLAPGAASQEPLSAPGIVIHHDPGLWKDAVAYLEAWPRAKARVEGLTGLELPGRVRLEVVAGAARLQERARAISGADLPSWVAGVAWPGRDLIVLRPDRSAFPHDRYDGLLTHELAHLALGTLRSGKRPDALPRWFDEGLAQVAEGRLFPDRGASLPARAFFGTLRPFTELDADFPSSEGGSRLAYAQSESFTRFLARRRPDLGGLRVIVESVAAGVSFEEAVSAGTRRTLDSLEEDWRATLRRDRSWMIETLVPAFLTALVLLALIVVPLRRARRRRELEAHWALDDDGESDAGPDQASSSSSSSALEPGVEPEPPTATPTSTGTSSST